MRGCDQHVNIILEKCKEKINADAGGLEFVSLGLYIVRGDNIAIIGEIDTEKDTKIDWSGLSASPLPPLTL
jgi:U6 snRNA-associated Sm-like protein LSm8